MSNSFWWQCGPIYQIYPRSFLDTNQDGIGDLEGIRRKLDYLQDLGIKGIWLSPVYPSPMFDVGYDVSCYHDIDPVYGSLEDMKRLIKETEQRGIAIIMDMVLNHTSHLHPWFVEASISKDNPYHDWYIWHEGKKGFLRRKRPNNWMAAFGGHAWEYNRTLGEYYLHLFTKEQPDLNWRNPHVEKTMFKEIKFWLDLGVKGFRLDVINYLVKDKNLKSNPYKLRLTYPRRHELQVHRYDRNQPETLEIIHRLREIVDAYGDTMLVGEVYPDEGVRSPELASTYLGSGSDLLHLAFDFSTMYTNFTAKDFRTILERWYSVIPAGGWPCHVLSNHDQSRAVSRYFRRGFTYKAYEERKAVAKLLAGLLLTQRGTPFIYYGEEIGMLDGAIPHKAMQDPLGKKYWPLHPGRDRSRTPMQWEPAVYGGFSSASPWLPVNPDFLWNNVTTQVEDRTSILNWYKKITALRHSMPALTAGSIEFVNSAPTILHYRRITGDASLDILLNIASQSSVTELQYKLKVLEGTHRSSHEITGSSIKLAPYEVIIGSKIVSR